MSVGLPVFNGERYLPRALESLLQQEYKNFEVIISDNASIDGTGEICKGFARRDERVRYFRNEHNVGLAPNHNRVFQLARGELFKWAAHDDEYPRAMLQKLVAAFDESPESVAVVYSVSEQIDENGKRTGVFSDGVDRDDRRAYRRLACLLGRIDVYNCTYGLIRARFLQQTRLHGSFPMADQVLFGELAMLGMFIELQEPLLRLRIHDGRSFTKYKDPQSLRELFDPFNKGKRAFLSIEGRVQLELLRSAWRVPPRLWDKLSCVCVAITVPSWRRFRGFGGRQKRKLRAMLSKVQMGETDAGRSRI